MGNRANLILTDHDLSIYLHWNGGPESVAAFLAYAHEVGIPGDDYYPARLMQIIGNFLGGTLSLGISAGTSAYQGCGDNGTYEIAVQGRDEPRIIHNGKRYTLSELVAAVQSDDYWQREETILDRLRAINHGTFHRDAWR